MSILNELLHPTDINVEELTTELSEYVTVVEELMDQMITEGEGSALDVVIKQMQAAKDGLSIVSRLKPGPDRAKHASRVMTNMNKIRGAISRITKSLAKAAGSAPKEASA